MAAVAEPALLSFRDRRRLAVSHSRTQRGLDHVEVRPLSPEVWSLDLCFVPPAPGTAPKTAVPPGISRSNVRISLAGGITETGLRVDAVEAPDGDGPLRVLIRRIAPPAAPPQAGDPLTYTLSLAEVANLDRFFSSAAFTLEAEPPPPRPAQPAAVPRPRTEPVLDYLAKDYESFRKLMLERMTLALPAWRERNPTDFGIAAVEVLAYAADYLSYFQDAVGTEAYLGTARRRTSLRRHARLLDYRLDEGTNARAWVQVQVAGASPVHLPRGTQILCEVAGGGPQPCGTQRSGESAGPLPAIPPRSEAYAEARRRSPQVFETMAAAWLFEAHNRMSFYTWGALDASLPQGATEAALLGHFPELRQGDVLILAEQDPREDPAGNPPGGAASRSHPVRLARPPQLTTDPVDGTAITEISWSPQDGLPFPLRLCTYRAGTHTAGLASACGNIVLADHGATVHEDLPVVPPAGLYSPRLQHVDLTVRQSWDPVRARLQPAAAATAQDEALALPAIVLIEHPGDGAGPLPVAPETWEVRYDLLSSGPFAREFTVEIENDRSARLRFGDGTLGRRPSPSSRFRAVYRVGSGTAGNLGPRTLGHVVTEETAICKVTNPVQATGGSAPELNEQVRLLAPVAFRTQERCVNSEDYVTAAQRFPGVLKAVCRQRWTGSWTTAFVYVEREGGKPVDDAFRAALRAALQPLLLAGSDLEVEGPRYLPLDIAFEVRLKPGVFHEGVTRSLGLAFGTGELPGGGRGFFHPDNFTFGQPVYLSEMVARATAVPGVDRLTAVRFQRWGQPPRGELQAGRIVPGELEIVRAASEPGAPQLGGVAFHVREPR